MDGAHACEVWSHRNQHSHNAQNARRPYHCFSKKNVYLRHEDAPSSIKHFPCPCQVNVTTPATVESLRLRHSRYRQVILQSLWLDFTKSLRLCFMEKAQLSNDPIRHLHRGDEQPRSTHECIIWGEHGIENLQGTSDTSALNSAQFERRKVGLERTGRICSTGRPSLVARIFL